MGFFLERDNPFLIKFDCTKAPGWQYAGERGKTTGCFVKLDRFADINITNAVTVSAAEWTVDVLRNPLDAATGHGFITGIDDRCKAFFPDGTPRQIDFSIDLLRVDSAVA